MRRARDPVPLTLLVLLLPGGVIPAQDSRPEPATRPARSAPVRLRAITIETRNVFAHDEGERNVFYWLPNQVHVPTDPAVIRREIWFGPDDVITVEQVEELERNLRRMGLFGAATASL